MKNRNVFALSIAMLAAISGYGGSKLYLTKCEMANNLMVMNVEALSDTEAPKKYKCYTSFEYEAGAAVVDYSTCKIYKDHTDKWYNFHDDCIVR